MNRRAWYRFAGAAGLLAVLALVTVPAEPKLRLCPFHWLTGWPCPFCGITRGLFSLAKLHWREALRFHALTPLALAMILSLFWDWRWRARLWKVGLAAFAVYGVCRIALIAVAA